MKNLVFLFLFASLYSWNSIEAEKEHKTTEINNEFHSKVSNYLVHKYPNEDFVIGKTAFWIDFDSAYIKFRSTKDYGFLAKMYFDDKYVLEEDTFEYHYLKLLEKKHLKQLFAKHNVRVSLKSFDLRQHSKEVSNFLVTYTNNVISKTVEDIRPAISNSFISGWLYIFEDMSETNRMNVYNSLVEVFKELDEQGLWYTSIGIKFLDPVFFKDVDIRTLRFGGNSRHWKQNFYIEQKYEEYLIGRSGISAGQFFHDKPEKPYPTAEQILDNTRFYRHDIQERVLLFWSFSKFHWEWEKLSEEEKQAYNEFYVRWYHEREVEEKASRRTRRGEMPRWHQWEY